MTTTLSIRTAAFAVGLALSAPGQAPIPLPIDGAPDQSSWRVEGADRGPVPIGNGKVFAALGLGARACELAAITGPWYGAGDVGSIGEGAFGGLVVELLGADGNALPITSRQVARISETGAVAAEDRSGAVALRMLAFAPASGTTLRALLAVDGDSTSPGLALRVRTTRAAVASGSELAITAGELRLRVALKGENGGAAELRDGALVLPLPGPFPWRGALALATGDDASTADFGATRAAFDASVAQWRETLSRTPVLDSDQRRFVDLVRDQKVALLTQRCATTGAIVPMLGRRVFALRTQIGALPALLRLGLHAEAKAVLDFIWDAIRAAGRMTDELPLSIDRSTANVSTTAAEFWRSVPMPPAELPSYVLLAHYWYWRATRDLSPIDAHWLLIDACLKRPVRGEDSMMPFSGSEPWSPPQLLATARAQLGDDPRLFGEAQAQDRASWSFASAVLFMLSVQAYGELSDARDERTRPEAWQKDKPTDAPSHAFLRRAITLMQDIEKRFWVADLLRFAPAVSPVDGRPTRDALANANLLPLWVGWTFPSGERSRDNLRSTLAALWQDGVRVGTTRTVPIATGDLGGMLLVALSERDDARRTDVVAELMKQAEPAGSWADWIGADGRPLDRDGDGPSRPVLLDPATSGTNLDAILFALTGIRHVSVPNWDDDDIRLELRLPHGADFISLRNAQKDGRALDLFWRRSRSKLTEDERKANDELAADRRRDPELEYERMRFVAELVRGAPKAGYYHADIDAAGTMFVRYLKPEAPAKPDEHDFRRIEEMEFSKADELVFLVERRGAGPEPAAAAIAVAQTARSLVLTWRETFANALRGQAATVVDTGSPLLLAEIESLLLDGDKPRHSSLLLDWRFDAPPPAQWNGALFASPAWRELLDRYTMAGGVLADPGFLRVATLDGKDLVAREDGALVVPPGDAPVTLLVPVEVPADRETALRVGSSIGFAVRADGAVVCAGRGRAPAAPDREAALFRIRGAERRLQVELAASPLLERVVFLRLARPDGLPLR